MPFLLPAAATAIAAAAPAAAAATAATAATSIASTIATVALNAATSMAISAVMSALQPQVGAAGRVSEWTLDPDGPIPFAAGRIGVSGSAVHRKTFGPDLMYLGIASVLSGAGPIDGYEGFQADDEAVAFDGAGKAITSQYANELWVKQTLGTQPDTALPLPAGLKAGGTTFGFGAGHKLSGMAADLVVMGENSKGTAYPTGEVKRLRILRGLKGWDPRLDSTYPGGAGPCRLDNPATWVYLTNPILWGLKWSLGLWSGPVGKGAPQVDCQVGGIGAKLSGIDVPAFVAAANVADANGWTVAAYPTTDDDKAQVLDAFLQAGGAIYAERAGKISCIQRAAPRTSIVTITAADTEGPIQIDTAASRIDRINTIRPRFWSEAHRWQLTALPEVTEPTWRVEDGGTRPRGIDYPYVTNAAQAAQLAALQIANSREGIAGVIPLKPYMQRIRPGDAFTINEPGFVLNGVKCLCLNTAYDPATGVVSVTFVSETDAKYPYALGQSPEVPEPAVLTPIDHTVSPPTVAEWALVATVFVDGGVSIPALLLTGAVDNARAQSVIFEYRPIGAPTWAFAGAEDPTIVRKEIATITAGTDYEVAISYRIGGLISDRLVLGPVTAGALVAGDVSPITPANVAGVPTIAVATLIAPDGTQISRLSGTWGAAADALSYIVELDNGTVVVQLPATSNAISQIVPTGPTYRYRVKALSRTGTPSAAWSAWSANGAASGDVTAPGVITGPYIQAGPRLIALGWTNPADTDLKAVVIYRNTVNNAGTATLLRITDGTYFTDTTVAPGTTYYYWASTVDRTGNESARTSIGAATARYINIGGGDIRSDDPDLVTDYGIAAGYKFQSRFGTALTLSLADSDIEGPWSAIEARPAVTQGSALTEDAAMADPSAWYVGGSATFVTINDGKVARTALRGTAGTFISARAVPVDPNKTYMIEGWLRRTGATNTAYGLVSMEDGAGNTLAGDGTYWLYHPTGALIPAAWTYYSRVFGAGTAYPVPALARQMRVGGLANYNGAPGAVEYQDLKIVEVVRIGGSLYRADGTVATESQIVTGLGTAAALFGSGTGAYANNLAGLNGAEGLKFAGIAAGAGSVITLVPLAPAKVSLTGNSFTKITDSANWTGSVRSQERHVGGAAAGYVITSVGDYHMFGLCGDAAASDTYVDIDHAILQDGATVRIYEDGTDKTGAFSAIAVGDMLWLTYDNASVRYYKTSAAGVTTLLYTSVGVAAGKSLFMQALAYSVGGGFGKITFGPHQAVARMGSNLVGSNGTTQYGQAQVVTIEGTSSGFTGQTSAATAPDYKVFNGKLENGNVTLPTVGGGFFNSSSGAETGYIRIVLPQAWTYSMVSFDIEVADYTGRGKTTYQVYGYTYDNGVTQYWANANAKALGDRNSMQTVSFSKSAAHGNRPCVNIGSAATVWAYPKVIIRDIRVGHTPISVAAWEAGWLIDITTAAMGSLDAAIGPAALSPDMIFGENAYETTGKTPATLGNFKTGLGTSAGFTGQTGWATLTRAVAAISKIDDAGRIIDGQALPLNGMSKSSTLSPAYPFSAGATPSTQINVAAVTATFAGGSTLSIGSATISGLTASTYYSIFRDLVANAYVAVSGSTTAYFTSAQRYLYIGTQATQEVGGGYEPLPPPPPGSGGGYGDIPLYVEP